MFTCASRCSPTPSPTGCSSVNCEDLKRERDGEEDRCVKVCEALPYET